MKLLKEFIDCLSYEPQKHSVVDYLNVDVINHEEKQIFVSADTKAHNKTGVGNTGITVESI